MSGTPIKIVNLVTNGGFSAGTSGWTMSTAYTSDTTDGACHITLKTAASSGTYPCYQAITVASNHTYYMTAKVKSAAGNVSGPRVYLSYLNSTSGATTFSDKVSSTTYPNDGEWYTFTGRYTVSATATMTRIAFGVSDCTTVGDNIWVGNLMIVDLTECFGAGNEPTAEWCDENIPFFEGTMELGFYMGLIISAASVSPSTVGTGEPYTVTVQAESGLLKVPFETWYSGAICAGEV